MLLTGFKACVILNLIHFFCKVNSTNRGLHLKEHPLRTMPEMLGFSCKTCYLLSWCLEWWPAHRCLDYRAVLDLLAHFKMSLLFCQGRGRELVQPVRGQVNSLAKRFVPCGIGGKRKLCMVPFPSYHLMGFGRPKRCSGMF